MAHEFEKQLLLDFDANPKRLVSVDEIYLTATQQSLSEFSEDRRVERKPARYSGDSLGEYFSMWANTSPEGGLIVVGQFDNGS